MEIIDNLEGATPRQRDFINDLLARRDYVLGVEQIKSPQEASELISKLLKAPKKATPVIKRDEELFEALSAVQKSKYAIPTAELILDFFDEKIENDLLFVEVREYEKTLYIRRLHGAVGGFTRTKLSRRDSLVILQHLAKNTYEYARLFGEHYSCCGKCGADLTDEKSRRLQLGPECRKAFGF